MLPFPWPDVLNRAAEHHRHSWAGTATHRPWYASFVGEVAP
jgi:hypothetical protein